MSATGDPIGGLDDHDAAILAGFRDFLRMRTELRGVRTRIAELTKEEAYLAARIHDYLEGVRARIAELTKEEAYLAARIHDYLEEASKPESPWAKAWPKTRKDD